MSAISPAPEKKPNDLRASLEAKLTQATELRQAGHLDEAEALLLALRRQDLHHVRVRMDLAAIARQRGDRGRALEYLEEARAADPGHPHLQMQIANELRELGRLDEARAKLRDLLDRQPDSVPGWIALAQTERRRGDRKAALGHYRQAAGIEPEHPTLPIDVAVELREVGRLEEAHEVLISFIDTHPESAPAWINLGHTDRRRGLREAALQSYRRALKLRPDHPTLSLDIAIELRDLGRFDEAQASLTSYLAANPESVAGWTMLGQIQRRIGERQGALTSFQRALARKPGDPALAIDVATELRELGRLHESHAALSGLLEEHPDSVAAWIGLGHTEHRAGNRSAALAHFRRALALRPDHPTLPLDVATELGELGRYEEARTVLQVFLDKHPDSVPAWISMGQLLRHRGDRQAAAEHFAQALTLTPEHTAAPLELASELRALGRFDEARALLLDTLERRPCSVQVLTHLAQLELGLGDAEAGHAWLDRALSQKPDHLPAVVTRINALAAAQDADKAQAVLSALPRAVRAHPAVRFAAARLIRTRGDVDTAVAEARILFAEVPDYPGLGPAFCQWLNEAGLPADALAQAATIPERLWRQKDLFLAQLALQDFDLESAIPALEAIVAERPDELGAYAALSRAHLMRGDLSAAKAVSHGERAARRAHPSEQIQRTARQAGNRFLIKELAANPFAEKRLRAAARKAGFAHRAQALAQIIAYEPGYVGPYLVLMVELRRRGFFEAEAAPEPGTAAPIPRRLMQFWHHPNPPAGIVTAMESWRRVNHDLEYERLTEEAGGELIRQEIGEDAYRSFRRARQPAIKADLLRLAWLYAKGGFYADADDFCRRPVSGLAYPGISLLGYQELHGSIANDFLAATPGHPVIGNALEEAVSNIHDVPDDSPWGATGPGLLTRHLCRHYLADMIQGDGGIADLRLLRIDEIRRHVSVHTPQPYKRTSRYWGNSDR